MKNKLLDIFFLAGISEAFSVTNFETGDHIVAGQQYNYRFIMIEFFNTYSPVISYKKAEGSKIWKFEVSDYGFDYKKKFDQAIVELLIYNLKRSNLHKQIKTTNVKRSEVV